MVAQLHSALSQDRLPVNIVPGLRRIIRNRPGKSISRGNSVSVAHDRAHRRVKIDETVDREHVHAIARGGGRKQPLPSSVRRERELSDQFCVSRHFPFRAGVKTRRDCGTDSLSPATKKPFPTNKPINPFPGIASENAPLISGLVRVFLSWLRPPPYGSKLRLALCLCVVW